MLLGLLTVEWLSHSETHMKKYLGIRTHMIFSYVTSQAHNLISSVMPLKQPGKPALIQHKPFCLQQLVLLPCYFCPVKHSSASQYQHAGLLIRHLTSKTPTGMPQKCMNRHSTVDTLSARKILIRVASDSLKLLMGALGP